MRYADRVRSGAHGASIVNKKQWPTRCAWCNRKLPKSWTFVAMLPNCWRIHHGKK